MRTITNPEVLHPYVMSLQKTNGGATTTDNGWLTSHRDPPLITFAENLVGSKGPGWHSVSHGKASTKVMPASRWIGYLDDGSTGWYEYYTCGWAIWVGPNVGADAALASMSGFSLPTKTVEEIERQAYMAMLPTVRSQASIPNALYELKDIVTLKRTGQNIITALRFLPNLFLSRRAAKLTLRDILRSMADNLLQQQFNVRPLIRDVTTLWNGLELAKARMSELIRNNERVITRHYNLDVTSLMPAGTSTLQVFSGTHGSGATHAPEFGEPSAKYTSAGTPGIWDPCGLFSPSALTRLCTTSCQSAKFTATMRFKYKLNRFAEEHALLAGMMDTLGVQLNPSIIWNAIPWSFVVDWVFKVSEYLDNYKISWVNPTVQVTDYCYSIKVKSRVVNSYMLLPSAHKGGVGYTVGAQSECSQYDRVVKAPPSRSFEIRLDKLDSQEYILAAALALAR